MRCERATCEQNKCLTQRGLESLKPKDKRYGKPDGTVPGLQHIVHPTGARSAVLLPRINGKQVSIAIEGAALMTLAEIRAKAKDKLREIAAGQDPRAAKREAERAESETVAVVVERFLERDVRPSKRTAGEIERKFRTEVLPRWGSRPISSIKQRDVIELLDAIVDNGAPVQANRVLSTIRRLFAWCRERGLIGQSPCEFVRKPTSETPRDRVLADFELATIWRASGARPYPFGSFFQLLMLLGQRREEIAGMKWSELDPALTLWTLPRSRSKNNVARQVPIVPAVREILLGLPRLAGCDFVFTTTGKTSVTGYGRAKEALDAAIVRLNGEPLAPWVVHDLRRTMASGMAKLGVALPTVEKLLNHKGASFSGVAGIYMRHDFADERRAALELWAEHVHALDRGPGLQVIEGEQKVRLHG